MERQIHPSSSKAYFQSPTPSSFIPHIPSTQDADCSAGNAQASRIKNPEGDANNTHANAGTQSRSRVARRKDLALAHRFQFHAAGTCNHGDASAYENHPGLELRVRNDAVCSGHIASCTCLDDPLEAAVVSETDRSHQGSCLILVGLEPTIPGSVDRCLIHWATGPLLKAAHRFFTCSCGERCFCERYRTVRESERQDGRVDLFFVRPKSVNPPAGAAGAWTLAARNQAWGSRAWQPCCYPCDSHPHFLLL